MFKIVHNTVRAFGYIFIIIPILLGFGLVWYGLFPLMALIHIALSDDASSFLTTIKEQYVDIPCDILKDVFGDTVVFLMFEDIFRDRKF